MNSKKFHYDEFIEDMIKAKVTTEREFTRWSGWKPSEKQKLLILAASKRERWRIPGRVVVKRENWKGKYMKVIRDKGGRFVSRSKWTWHKRR